MTVFWPEMGVSFDRGKLPRITQACGNRRFAALVRLPGSVVYREVQPGAAGPLRAGEREILAHWLTLIERSDHGRTWARQRAFVTGRLCKKGSAKEKGSWYLQEVSSKNFFKEEKPWPEKRIRQGEWIGKRV